MPLIIVVVRLSMSSWQPLPPKSLCLSPLKTQSFGTASRKHPLPSWLVPYLLVALDHGGCFFRSKDCQMKLTAVSGDLSRWQRAEQARGR